MTANVPSIIIPVTKAVPYRKAECSLSLLPAPQLNRMTGKQPWIKPFTVITINCCTLKYAPKKAIAVSEYATRNRLTNVTINELRAFIIKDGKPKAKIRRIICFCK